MQGFEEKNQNLLHFRGVGCSPSQKLFRQCLNDRNRSERLRVIWAQRKSRPIGRSAENIQTRASTGPVVNRYAMAVAANGNFARYMTCCPPKFFSVAHNFGATGRNRLQRPSDNYSNAPCGALITDCVTKLTPYSPNYNPQRRRLRSVSLSSGMYTMTMHKWTDEQLMVALRGLQQLTVVGVNTR